MASWHNIFSSLPLRLNGWIIANNIFKGIFLIMWKKYFLLECYPAKSYFFMFLSIGSGNHGNGLVHWCIICRLIIFHFFTNKSMKLEILSITSCVQFHLIAINQNIFVGMLRKLTSTAGYKNAHSLFDLYLLLDTYICISYNVAFLKATNLHVFVSKNIILNTCYAAFIIGNMLIPSDVMSQICSSSTVSTIVSDGLVMLRVRASAAIVMALT